MTSKYDLREDVYPTIISGFDRAARSGRKATIYHNYTPELFKQHASEIIEEVQGKEDEHKIIFLKSWNEWAEGNYMEPDLKYGHDFLDALRDCLMKE